MYCYLYHTILRVTQSYMYTDHTHYHIIPLHQFGTRTATVTHRDRDILLPSLRDLRLWNVHQYVPAPVRGQSSAMAVDLTPLLASSCAHILASSFVGGHATINGRGRGHACDSNGVQRIEVDGHVPLFLYRLHTAIAMDMLRITGCSGSSVDTRHGTSNVMVMAVR